MKKIILAAMLLISCAVQAQQATDVTVRQRNQFNTGWLDRFLSPPAGGVDGVLYIDGSAVMPGVLTLGPGLAISGGVLNSVSSAPSWASITGKPSFATVATSGAYSDLSGQPALFSGAYVDLTGKPTIPAAQVNSDWAAASGMAQILNKPALATVATTGAYADLSGRPTIPTVTPFNFSAPAARTLALSTQYQANDPTRAAVLTISPSCTNASTLLAASACTLQIRQSASAGAACSTGTVVMTWTSIVPLGLVFSQTSGSPFDVKIPAGGYFAICPTAGTFTIAAVEQSAA